MPLKTILFDLDETLYPADAGIWQAIKGKIETYMTANLGIPADKVDDLRQHYYETYGTSLRGLEKDYDIQAADYLDFVHDIPIEDYLQPDHRLREILQRIPIRKVIFTNASIPHARRVLDSLGIADQFSMIIDVVQFTPSSKPFPEAFQKAMQLIGDPIAENYLLIDDALMNIRTAAKLGMKTILIDPTGMNPEGYLRVQNIYEIADLVPELLADVYDQK